VQFSILQAEVASQSNLDLTNVNIQTSIARWLNITQQDIVGRWPWNFLRGEENLTTVADYKTGTVSVPSGGTTVTGVGTTFTTAMADGTYKIQFAGALDWYTIATYVSATSITIGTAYAPASALSAGTFTIRRMYYPLSSNCDRIIDAKNNNTPIKMFETDMRTLDSVSPTLNSTNNSYAFVAWTTNTAAGSAYFGNTMIQLYPFPSDSRLIWVKTLLRASDLLAATDVSVIPAKWHHILIWGACALAFMYKREAEVATLWKTEYEHKIEEMMLQGKLSEDDAPVLKSVDSVARGSFIQMPGNYPVVGGR
jgi:hypothetical protein